MHQPYLIEIDPKRIKFNPLNPRKHRGLEYIRLRTSIKTVDIVQFPTVRALPGGFFEAIDGEGRISVALEEGFATIWVVCLGDIDDDEALLMLQSANTARSYDFIAECKGLAALHRQEMTNNQLATQFSKSIAKITTMVGVGHLPEKVLRKIEEHIAQNEEDAGVWTYNLFESLLPLRENLPGNTQTPGFKWISLDGLYNYDEVDKAVDKVIAQEIKTGEQMHAYVSHRKYEIYQERFDQDLQKRLKMELEKIKKQLEETKEKQLHEEQEKIQSRYKEQIDILELQKSTLEKQNKEIIKDISRNPAHIQEREKELKKALDEAHDRSRSLERQRIQWEKEREKERKILEQKRLLMEQENLLRKKEMILDAKKILEEERSLQDKEQKEKLKRAEEDLKEFYRDKDAGRQFKAENTIRGLLSHGVKTLAEAQQTIEHIVSDSMIEGVQQLGGAQQESLLWAIRSLNVVLERAEEKLTGGNIMLRVEGGISSGSR